MQATTEELGEFFESVAGLLCPDQLPPPVTPVDPDAATDLRDAMRLVTGAANDLRLTPIRWSAGVWPD